MKFKKIVGVDETLLNASALEQLRSLGEEVFMYHDFPLQEKEIIDRIGNADCVLVSFRTLITRAVLDACPNIRYIGMCCTLYDPSSCNVDVIEAYRRGITVLGVKDYGDEGVVEYVICELVRLLHGFGGVRWLKESTELTQRKIGIVGLGKTGRMIADALSFLGADVSYYSRTRKPEACLPRNNYILGEKEFELMGNGKILVNTSVGQTFQTEAICNWLRNCPDSFYLCDATGMGGLQDRLNGFPNVLYTPYISGKSIQSIERLSQKVLANMRDYLSSH